MTKVLDQVVGYQGVQGSLLTQAEKIAEFMDSDKCPFSYITFLIHNIEATGLANEATQSALCILAQCNSIYVVASCDHINTAMIWDHSTLASFNFAWHDITGFQGYFVETSFETFGAVGSTNKGSKGIKFVLRSLPSNGKRLFSLLASRQLIQMEDNIEPGLLHEEFFRVCREGFVLDNMVAFQTLLTEFKDHEIIVSRVSSEGTVWYIPVSKQE